MRQLMLISVLAALAVAAGCAAARPDPNAVIMNALDAQKGRHIIDVLEESGKVDTVRGLKHYLAFDTRTEEGESFKYHFILFYRCSYGDMNTGNLILTTNRQGVIQQYAFEPIWCPASPRASIP